MQYKASLLLAALAGSAVARPHAHERRHAHAKAEAAVEERAVGDEVYATIDNVLVSWINNWAGEATTTTSTTTTPAPVVVPTTTAEPTTTAQPAPTSGSGSGSGSGSSSSGGNWFETPSNGVYSRKGFGGSTSAGDSGSGQDWSYIGNVGSPWGSNIIEVDADSASSYKHVLRLDGSKTSDWTVVFWNTYGPNNKMDGFWSPNAALTLHFAPGETKYVAIDDDSQGAFTAGPGSSAPVSPDGQYGGTWGEFDMSSGKNDGYSGWDVSCIIAELADLFVHGMRICDHKEEKCSSIGAGITDLLNAYTSADQGKKDKALSVGAGPVRLIVQLDY